MATAVKKLERGRAILPGRRYDRQFFMGIVILLIAVVAIGFAPTYYLAGVFRAPLPSPILHIHAVVFTGWMLLLLVQTGLVSAKRVQLHRKRRRGLRHTRRVGLCFAKKSRGAQTPDCDCHSGTHWRGVLPLACFISLPQCLCRRLRCVDLPRASGSLRSLVDAQDPTSDAVGRRLPDFHETSHHPRGRTVVSMA